MIYARFWIDAAIQAGASHINNLMNWGINSHLQRQQNEWNERMAGMANQWNIDQWERENEYNLPVNQVSRLQAAGINPALAMGQGASAMISGQQADAIAPANVPQGAQPPYLPYSDAKLDLIGEKLAEAQAEKAQAEADAIKQKLPHEVNQLQEGVNLLKKQQDEIDGKLDLIMSQINNTDEHTRYLWSQRFHTWFEERMSTKEFDLKLDEYNLAVKNFQQSVKESNERIKQMAASTGLMKSEAFLNKRTLFEMSQTFGDRLMGLRIGNYNAYGQFQLLGFNLGNMKFNSDTGFKFLYGQGPAGRNAVRVMTLGSDIISSFTDGAENLWKATPFSHKMDTFKKATQSMDLINK